MLEEIGEEDMTLCRFFDGVVFCLIIGGGIVVVVCGCILVFAADGPCDELLGVGELFFGWWGWTGESLVGIDG